MADIVNQILLNVDAGDASTKIGDIKRAIKELEGVALASGDANSEAFLKATQAAGQLRDRLEDVKDATKTFKGDPLEGLSKGLGSLKGRLADLDFQGFNEEIGRLNTLSKQTSFKDLAGSVGETAKSFGTLGKVLLTNPIFLLGTAIATIVSNFDQLKEAGGFIGKLFTGISDSIDFVIEGLKELGDFFGITNFKAQQLLKDQEQAAKDSLENIRDFIQNIGKDVEDKRQEFIDKAGGDLQKASGEYQGYVDQVTADNQQLIDDYESLISEGKKVDQYQTDRYNAAVKENKELVDSVKKTQKEIKDAQVSSNAPKIAEAQANELRIVKDGLSKQLLERKQFYDKEVADLIAAKTQLGDFSTNAEQEIADKRKENNLKILQDSLTILEEERIEVQNNRKLANKDRIALEEELANKILETRNQITIGIRDIEKSNIQELQKDVQDAYAGIATGITQEASQETLDLTKSTTEQLAALNEQYRNGEIKSLEDYEKQKSKIIEDEEDKRRQIELDSAQKRLTNIENEAKNALALLPEGSEEYKNAKTQYDAERIAQEQVVADKLREINQDLTDDQIAAEAKLAVERDKNRLATIKIAEDTFAAVSATIAQTSQGFETLGTDILQAASNIGGAITSAVKTFGDENASATDKAIAGFQAASAAIGEIGNILTAQADRRLEEIERNKEAEIQASEDSKEKLLTDLEDQLSRGVITKEEFDAKKIAIEQKIATEQFNINEKARKAEYDAKKKVFEQEKKVRIAQAIASGAQAAISAFASGAAVPLVGPVTTGPAFAAISAAFTAAQVALIASQKFEAFQAGTPPSFPSPSVSTPGGGGGGEGNNTFSPPQFFGLGQGIFQNQAAGQQTQQVVVLESDITRVQDRVRVIEDRSVIG
jgi:hypothetical protein